HARTPVPLEVHAENTEGTELPGELTNVRNAALLEPLGDVRFGDRVERLPDGSTDLLFVLGEQVIEARGIRRIKSGQFRGTVVGHRRSSSCGRSRTARSRSPRRGGAV